MENKTKKNLARGIIAAGGVLSGVALNELILSKEEHDRKEREISKIEKEKDKYMKKIGVYEPFNVDKGNVTPNDSKLVNLLTRAIGVAVTNNDVFTRNKSNVRTFPFIISNNTSINASVEVELRKYYDVMVASQVANLINHTVFAAENILNVKDDSKRSADKVIDKILSRDLDIQDFGTSMQKGIYENVLFEKDGNIISLNEEYTQAYPSIDQYINDYQRVIKTYVSNVGEKNKLIKSMEDIKEKRKELLDMRRNINTGLDFTLKAGETLDNKEKLIENDIRELFKGKLSRNFDDLEDEDIVKEFVDNKIDSFQKFMKKYDGDNGKDIASNILDYMEELRKYQIMLGRGITIINNNNFSEPNRDLADADPYYRLLDLNRVDNYDDSATLTMKMFRNSNSLKVKLEMAAALLISTEILPFEFIEYATKYLGLHMHDKTKRSIGMKYGMGTQASPFRFMGNEYIMSKRSDIMKFYGEMRPNEIEDKDKLVKDLTRRQLRANSWSFFDFLRNRTKLEKR
jgi:hypothetical protein